MRPIRHLRITGLLGAIALAVMLAGLVGGARAAPARQFAMIDLTPDATTFGGAVAVSNNGHVVGRNDGRPFVWTQADGMIQFGDQGWVTAVSESAQVVGYAYRPEGTTWYPAAFSWTQDGGMVDLGTLGGPGSAAGAVNDSGQVIGGSDTATGASHAFSWTQDGGMVDLGTLGGRWSVAGGISDNGEVIGWSTTPDELAHVFSWTESRGMVDLGMLGGSFVDLVGVTSSRQVVGVLDGYGPFSWTPDGGLVQLPGEATDVNDSGQVVGWTEERAYLWTESGGTTDLGTLGGFSYATAISDNGRYIVGQSDIGGVIHAFSWTQDGGMVDLGALFGYSGGEAVNNSGLVVGWSDVMEGYYQHPTVWLKLPASSHSAVYYLHGSGATANPPILTLNGVAPTSATDKYSDSSSIKFSGGNLWKEVGTWTRTLSGEAGTLYTLDDLHAWLGLKNSDDQGTAFDLKAELYLNGRLIASGVTRAITGVTRNPSQAREAIVRFGADPVTVVSPGDVVKLKLSTRIGTNSDDTRYPGHANATGLRLYYDSSGHPAQYGETTAS